MKKLTTITLGLMSMFVFAGERTTSGQLGHIQDSPFIHLRPNAGCSHNGTSYDHMDTLNISNANGLTYYYRCYKGAWVYEGNSLRGYYVENYYSM